MQRPLITCGITAFNAADSIERAVISALSQSWRPLEIVVVDDASSDATTEVLMRLAEAYPEVRVFHQAENGGVAKARNRILAEAKGEFLAFFDDDDVSSVERIQQQFERITVYERDYAEGEPVICHTARQIVYPNGSERIEKTMGQTHSTKTPNGEGVAFRILFGQPLKDAYGSCATCSQMARLSTYRMLGGFDETLRRGEDTEFNIRLALAGGHFVGIADALVKQTMTKTSEKSLREEHRNLCLIMEKHQVLMKAHGQYEFCRRWIDMKLIWQEGRKLAFIFALAKLAMTSPILTIRRLFYAMPNIGLNSAYSHFHQSGSQNKS